MGYYTFTASIYEMGIQHAKDLGKDPNKVKRYKDGAYFYDPINDENTPSCLVTPKGDGDILAYRHGGDASKQYSQNNDYRTAIAEWAVNKGLCKVNGNRNPKVITLDPIKEVTEDIKKRANKISEERARFKQPIFKAGDIYPLGEKQFEITSVHDYKLKTGELHYQRIEVKGSREVLYNRELPNKRERVLYNLDKLYEAKEAQETVLDTAPYKTIEYQKEALLKDMTELKNWLFWNSRRDGKKFPCDESRNPLLGWRESNKWKHFDDLIENISFGSPLKKGFFFTMDDPFIFLDFDDVLQAGEKPSSYKLNYKHEPITAQDIEGYFVETSFSGTGYHIIIKLKDAKLKKKLTPITGGEKEKVKLTGFECYLDWWCACTLNEVDNFSLELIEGVKQNKRVFITETEKEADLLTSKGLLATTCGKALSNERGNVWQSQYTETLKGFDCVILTNRAPEWLMLGNTIAGRLFHSKHDSGLKLVTFSEEEMPKGLPEYLDSHSVDELLAKVESVPEYKPTQGDLAPITDKIPIKTELEKLSFDVTGNAQRVLDYTGGIFKWVDDGGEKQAFVYDIKKGAWLQSYDKAVALAQIALRRIPEEIAEKHKGLDEKGSEIATKWARSSQSPKAAKDALETTYSLKGSTLQVSDFDLHPKQNKGKCFINCKNGIVNLATGELLEHSREAHITQYCDREYNPNLTSPLWEKCLLDIFEGDQSLVDNFQLHIGYASMGYPKEKAFFVLHGDMGDTGKSTVLETIKNVLGVDYAGEIPFSTIQINEHSDSDKPNTFLSRVKKAHIVTISETESKEGRRASLNFEKVKTLSGADSIPIRDLYKPATSFIPKFTLIMALNNKPRIGDIKNSTWDRMRLFPFVHKFEGKEKDPNMGSKLIAEADGIFNWIVQGAIKYTQLGELPKHPKVVEAVKEYKEEENPLEVWFEDCIILGSNLVEKVELLQESGFEYLPEEYKGRSNKAKNTRLNSFLKGKGLNFDRRDSKIRGIQLTPKERDRILNNLAQETFLDN